MRSNDAIIVLIYGLLIVLISIYSLDVKIKYPKIIIILFNEPSFRFMVYLSIYACTYFNVVIAYLFLIATVFLHIDVINLLHTEKYHET